MALAGLGLAALRARRILRAPDAPGQGAGARPPGRPGLPEADAAAATTRPDAAEAPPHDRRAWPEAGQDAAGLGAWEFDIGTRLMRWSDGQFRLHGLEPGAGGEIGEDRWRAAIEPADLPALDAARAEAPESGAFEAEYRIRREDGSIRWLAARAAVERDAEGRPRRLLGVSIDITRRRALEEGREELLRMKDLMVTEVHHRVKNSLQLMHGVLLMQARVAGPEAAPQLRQAAARVLTVAAVHRRLYEEGAEHGTDLAAYLSGLVDDLRGSLTGAAPGAEIRLEVEPGLRLSANQLAPLGLVATELVTNALKYGAAPVVVRCRQGPGGMDLAVEDAGPGFPPGFDPTRSRGLGMRLSVALARHHRGRLEIDRAAPGGRVVLTLAETPADNSATP